MTSEIITSGATPVNCSTAVDISYVVSGGTGGKEIVILPQPSLDANGNNLDFNGRWHTIALKTQTNPNDLVCVRLANTQSPIAYDDAGNPILETTSDGIVLDYVGAVADFQWRDSGWCWIDPGNNDAVIHFSQKREAFTSYDNETTPGGALNGFAQIRISTSGTGGVEGLFVSTPHVEEVGQRLNFKLVAKGAPGDSAILTGGNIQKADGSAVTSITFSNMNDYLVIEGWNTSVWRIVRGTATVV